MESADTPQTRTDEAVTLAAVVAERYGVVPERQLFADFLALIAAFFLAHPEVPLPYFTRLHCHVGTLAELEQLAAAYGTYVYGKDLLQAQIPTKIDGGEWSHDVLVSLQPEERPL